MNPSKQPSPDPATQTGRANRPGAASSTTTDVAEDADLLEAARAGHDSAFAALIERYDPALRRLASNLLDGEDTEATLIDAYVKAYRALGRPHPDALPWLARITYLACLDRLRRRELRRLGGPGRLPPRAGASAPGSHLSVIPPDQRAVLVLLDGLHLDEGLAADVLAVPAATVAGLLARGRRAVERDGPGVATADAPLPTPEFWTRLGRQLLSERDAPAAPVPRLPGSNRVAPSGRPSGDPPHDPVAGLAIEARRRRPPTRTKVRARSVRVLAILAVLAVTAAAVTALVRMASSATSPVRTNSVADVSRRSTAAMAELDAFSATVTRTVIGARGRAVDTFRFVRTRDGSFAVLRPRPLASVTYDARTDTLRRSASEGWTRTAGSQESGLAAGPPDPSGFDPALPDAELGLAWRTLAGVTGVAAVAGRVDGIDAWTLTGPVPEESRTQGIDAVTLVVDQAHLAPVGLSYTAGGRQVRSLRFTHVSLDGLTPETFTIGADRTGSAVDRGFRPMGLRTAAVAVGREPLRPTYLPPGFELSAVTVRTEGATLALRYRRGFERVDVTTRTSPVARGAVWSDPFPRSDPVDVRSVALDEGPFRLTRAQRVVSVGALASLWGSDGKIAFTVSGDLSADQLLRVARSLRT